LPFEHQAANLENRLSQAKLVLDPPIQAPFSGEGIGVKGRARSKKLLALLAFPTHLR
jgi:hypothetical protein